MVLLAVITIVTVLVAWALRLMRGAVEQREFSLMLAGLLVSSAAAGLIGVYFLMSSCFSHMTTLSYASEAGVAYPQRVTAQELNFQSWQPSLSYDSSASTNEVERKLTKS
jgi:hypothetical protein